MFILNKLLLFFQVAQKSAGHTYDQILGTLYGLVSGDAIGHLTENLTKDHAQKVG